MAEGGEIANLEVHHIIEQASGGGHELSNLCLLCSGHHAALHEGLLTIRGSAPYEIQFRWRYGAPIPAGLEAEVRQAIIAQRVREILDQPCVPAGTDRDAKVADVDDAMRK